MIYFVMSFLLGISMFFDYIKKYQRNIILPVIMLTVYTVLSFFAGLRYDMGLDYYSYEGIFYDVAPLEDIFTGKGNFFEVHGEIGYLFLNSIIKTLGGDYTDLLLLIAFFSIGVLCYSSYLYSLFPMTTIFLYFNRFFLTRDMGQIRAGVAAALFIFSIKYIEERQLYKFLGIIIIACLFHKVAAIGIFVYFLSRFRFKNKHYYIGLIISVILGVVIPFKELLAVFIGMDSIIIDYAFSEFGESLSILNPVALMQSLILILFIYFRKKIEPICYGYNTILNIYAFSTYWLFVFNQLGIIAGRVATLPATVEILILPTLIFITGNKYMRVVILLVIVLFSVTFMYLNLNKDGVYERLVPYRNLFW